MKKDNPDYIHPLDPRTLTSEMRERRDQMAAEFAAAWMGRTGRGDKSHPADTLAADVHENAPEVNDDPGGAGWLVSRSFGLADAFIEESSRRFKDDE